ncbi:MAG: 2-oxo acid dehydrogenase subunit E2 [Burkholderiales bacterium]|nr:2-oxo acid dehydrogenase subunit E2 [Burkholderiales bacterium]
MIEFKLPSLGADMDRGRLLEWRVKPGDVVKRGDVVAVVDTSKAAIDVEVWHAGTVHALLLQPGDDVPVGTAMLTLSGADEPVEAAAQTAPGAAERAAAPAGPAGPAPLAVTPAASPEPALGRRRISPAARKRAEELGISLDTLAGTGPDGAVTIEDVQRAGSAAVGAAPAAAVTPAAAAIAERMSAMRQTIAAAMARSKREIPHYYLATEIPLEKATQWLTRANAERPVTARILMAALLIKATALAARKYPELNGFYRGGKFEPSAEVHVGVAISLRQGGLIAPALLATDRKNVDEIMAALADLVKRTRAFSLRASELSQPTITLTNLGEQGVELVQAVIYPPQVAIVGFGKPIGRAWVEDHSLRLIPVVTASLAADHRVSDGHRGALFLAHVRDLLQEPDKL